MVHKKVTYLPHACTHGITLSCGCYVDGFFGEMCHLRHEMYCINQCSGHGVCWLGFCKCDLGWYGTDCVRRMAGMEMESGKFIWAAIHVDIYVVKEGRIDAGRSIH